MSGHPHDAKADLYSRGLGFVKEHCAAAPWARPRSCLSSSATRASAAWSRNWLELRRLRGEIATLRGAGRRDLDQRLKLLRSGHGQLERAARKELGFIKKGEVEYRFPPPAPNPASDAKALLQ